MNIPWVSEALLARPTECLFLLFAASPLVDRPSVFMPQKRAPRKPLVPMVLYQNTDWIS